MPSSSVCVPFLPSCLYIETDTVSRLDPSTSIDEVLTRKVRVKWCIELHGLDSFMNEVVVSVDGIEFLVDHEVGGPKLVMNVFSIGL